MLKNYWKTAIRNMLRNKGFSLLNIVGLAMGMASATLIILWIQHERSYDRWHEKNDRLYELMTSIPSDGKLRTGTPTPEIMPPAIQHDCPEVEDVVRVGWNDNMLFAYGDKSIKASGASADTGFFNLFSFPLLKGDRQAVLRDPGSIVVTESMAKKLFGNEDAMGKVVRFDNQDRFNFTVTGIMKDLPDNSQFKFEWLNSYNFRTDHGWIDSDWTDVNNRAFVLLKPHANAAMVNARLHGMIQRYSNGRTPCTAFIYPMDRMHLYGEFEDEKPSGGRIVTVQIFGLIAGLLLLIGCINFMNLSTARSERRGREVGIRKVVGARKGGIVLQFLCESVLTALVSGFLCLLIVQLSLPAFGRLTGKHLSIGYTDASFWLSALAFVLFTGLLAGSYPAFFLSTFRPVAVLKGSFKKVHALLTPRKVLVVVQFTIAVVLIVSTVVIARQIKYAEVRKTGYDQQNLLYVYLEGDIYKHYDAIREELLGSGAVTAMSLTGSPLTETYSSGVGLRWEGSDPKGSVQFMRTSTNGDIVKAAGLQLVAGRDIDVKTYPTDSTACLINEAAWKATGFKKPLGQQIYDDPVRWHVVGVFKDFVLSSPYERIKPLIIKGPRYGPGCIHIRLNGAFPTAQNLAQLERTLKKFNPAYPVEYHFIDEDYAHKFEDSKLTGKLANLFALLTILISCLGLFGLAAYMVESRTKEMSIRKVLGASAARISFLLSSGFIRLIFVSILIAVPIAWYAMDKWLANYPYRVGVQWWYFAVAGLAAVLIALLAVSTQAIRAAIINPVNGLRSE